ncbi:MAG: TonB-dependent receptor plug domain-containing protein [Calditrichia bacterium]
MITCLLSGLIIAQDRSGKISGVVTDPAQKPVAEVYVSLNPINRTALTGQNGYFEFSGIPAGTYSLSFRHISYQDKSIKDISVDTGQITEVDTVQLQERIFPSEEVSVTATRTERNLFEVSKPLNLVNSRQIENREAKTSAEALREEAGLFVQKTNHGGGSAIIRGLSSNQILLLVDGVRLNNSTYRLGNHQYLTTVDNQMVDRIEVVRGPSSLMYGSDALGGTINILTRNPDFVSGGLQFQSRLFNRYATADEEKTYGWAQLQKLW